jgi:hypothetical protein
MFVTPVASQNVPAAWPGLAQTRPLLFSCMKAYPQATPENNSVIARKTSKISINDHAKTQPAGIALQEVQGWPDCR